MKSVYVRGLMALTVLAIGTAAIEARADKAGKTIVDVAVADGNFTTLVTALKAAGLVDTLKGEGPFTVFAPTDDAFKKVPADALKALLKDKAKLTKVLTFHVVKGKVLAADAIAMDGKSATSVEGGKLPIKVSGGTVMIDGAKVIKADIKASNGVIHVIDTVLMPND